MRSLRLAGATQVPAAALETIAAPFLNRPLRPLDLEELRLALTRAYVERGFVSSGAVLADGAFEDGRLTITLVEGRVAEVRQRGLNGLSENYLAARLVEPGEVLHQGTLQERFQLLLGDPLFERLNVRLLPGDAPGRSVLDVEATRARPWSLALFAHNHVAPAVGSETAGIELAARNLLGWGDQLGATLSTSDGSAGGELAWSVPLAAGKTLLTLRAGRTRSSVIEEPLAELDIASRVSTREATLTHPVIDTPRQRIALGLAASRRSNTTTLSGEPFSFVPGEPSGTTRVNAWRLFTEALWREERQVLAAQLSVTRGHDNVGPAPDQPRVPAPRYSLLQAQAQAVLPLAEAGRQVVLRGQIQRSSDALVPLEQVAIGGRRTVRGYRENQLVRDNGWALSAELHWPLWRSDEQRAALTLVPFVDAGSAWNRGEARRRLASAGAGLQLSWGDVEFELFAAKRLESAPASTRGDIQDHGIHVLLRYRPSF